MEDYALPQDRIPSRMTQTSLNTFPAEIDPPAKRQGSYRCLLHLIISNQHN